MPARKGLILYLLATVLLSSSLVFGQESRKVMPRILSVAPASGQVGDEVIASGENLDQTNVTELSLTNGTNDFKVSIVSQTPKVIKFKIPNEVKPGRYGLVTLSKMTQPPEVEQPVKLTVKQ